MDNNSAEEETKSSPGSSGDMDAPHQVHQAPLSVAQVYTGGTKVWCAGRLYSGDYYGEGVVIWALFMGVSAAFFAVSGPYLWRELSPAVPIVMGYIFALTFANLLRTNFTEPGAFPRALASEGANFFRRGDRDESKYLRQAYRTDEVNGLELTFKYCHTCHQYRKPRSTHCRSTNDCVDEFDHFCPWVNNTIGHRNYRFFALFVNLILLHIILIIAFTIYHLATLRTMRENLGAALAAAPTLPVVLFFAIVSLFFVLNLCTFHANLQRRFETTNEYNKRRYGSRQSPFHRGSRIKNCLYILFGPRRPSLIKYRAQASAYDIMVYNERVTPSKVIPDTHVQMHDETDVFTRDVLQQMLQRLPPPEPRSTNTTAAYSSPTSYPYPDATSSNTAKGSATLNSSSLTAENKNAPNVSVCHDEDSDGRSMNHVERLLQEAASLGRDSAARHQPSSEVATINNGRRSAREALRSSFISRSLDVDDTHAQALSTTAVSNNGSTYFTAHLPEQGFPHGSKKKDVAHVDDDDDGDDDGDSNGGEDDNGDDGVSGLLGEQVAQVQKILREDSLRRSNSSVPANDNGQHTCQEDDSPSSASSSVQMRHSASLPPSMAARTPSSESHDTAQPGKATISSNLQPHVVSSDAVTPTLSAPTTVPVSRLQHQQHQPGTESLQDSALHELSIPLAYGRSSASSDQESKVSAHTIHRAPVSPSPSRGSTANQVSRSYANGLDAISNASCSHSNNADAEGADGNAHARSTGAAEEAEFSHGSCKGEGNGEGLPEIIAPRQSSARPGSGLSNASTRHHENIGAWNTISDATSTHDTHSTAAPLCARPSSGVEGDDDDGRSCEVDARMTLIRDDGAKGQVDRWSARAPSTSLSIIEENSLRSRESVHSLQAPHAATAIGNVHAHIASDSLTNLVGSLENLSQNATLQRGWSTSSLSNPALDNHATPIMAGFREARGPAAVKKDDGGKVMSLSNLSILNHVDASYALPQVSNSATGEMHVSSRSANGDVKAPSADRKPETHATGEDANEENGGSKVTESLGDFYYDLEDGDIVEVLV